MRKLFLLCLLLPVILSAQQRFHVTLFGGFSNYQGDLQQRTFTFDQSNGAFGASLKYDVTSHISIRSEFKYGSVQGDDKQNKPILQARNLSFKSKVVEANLRAGSDRRGDMIGLTFEPARGRGKPDIAGTLWLDRKTAELRDLEYVYRNLPALPIDMGSEEFGGRIEFHRMPTGAWIVERWVIRMPMIVDKGRFASQGTGIPGAAPPAQRIQLGAIKEEGGEVTQTVARGEQRSLARDVGSVRGTVFDSTRMTGLRDARVFLDGTQFSTRSDTGGAFVIDDVPAGTYTLSVAHPRFDSLHARAPSSSVELRGGEPSVAELSGPSAATLLARDCTAYERSGGGASLRGKTAAIGLVPNSAREPFHAGIAAGELLNASPTMPCSATPIKWYAATPKW
jgi:hypothetical protein